MSGVAIVAVPNKSDPVWAVSSQKIPHMTLLYLGDALAEEDYRKVQEFVTHVADTTLHRFGMSVDKRGTLGDDDADVLFFHNEENSAISLFRAYLLQDTTIREAYEKTEQFDGWTPHLTLGYPDSPAKKDPREVSEFYYIGFDKLMIWTDEFAGPEIELNDLGAAVAMSGVADATQTFLAHYGVKGQRWGVRKSISSQERLAKRSEKKTAKNEKAAAKLVKIQTKNAKAERKAQKEAAGVDRANARKAANPEKPGKLGSKKEWRQKSLTQETAMKVLDDAGPRIVNDLRALGQSLPDRPLKGRERRAYDRQAVDIINQHLDTSARSIVGVSPNGRKTATASMSPNGTMVMRITRTKTAERRANLAVGLGTASYILAQADDDVDFEEFELKVARDKNGFIKGLELIDAELGLAQSDLDNGTSFLEHYGVKGMQWGVRRSREERRADRTAKVQAAAEKKVAKAEQYTARANAKASVAKARTATADAKAAAANARLETKLAEKQAKFAKAEARTGKDDPANGLVRDTSGVVGKSDREAKSLRDAAAKDVRTLDDQTLKAYAERLSTEKKLKDTIKQDQKPGRTATKQLIADSGKQVAKTALVGAGSLAVYYLLGRLGERKGANERPKPIYPNIGDTMTNPKARAKDAWDFGKEAADTAANTKIPKSKYPGAIPTTGRALPTTGSSAPPGYKRKPGFDPDNWTLRPGKEP